MISIRIQGDKELLRELDRLESNMRKKAIRRAVTAAARPIRVAYRANVPRRFGWLRKSIDVKTKTYRGETTVAIIGSRSDVQAIVQDRFGNNKTIRPAKYAHLVESGTKAHLIPLPGSKKPGAEVAGPGSAMIHHPGSRGTAPLLRAFEGEKANAMAIMESKLRESLTGAG